MVTMAKYNRQDFEQILSKVRLFNSEIGNYVIHANTEDFNFNVKLNNGRIKILWEELQDKDFLDNKRLQAIANRFQSDRPKIIQDENSEPKIDNKVKNENLQELKEKNGKKSRGKKGIFDFINKLGIVVGIVAGIIAIMQTCTVNEQSDEIIEISTQLHKCQSDIFNCDSLQQENLKLAEILENQRKTKKGLLEGYQSTIDSLNDIIISRNTQLTVLGEKLVILSEKDSVNIQEIRNLNKEIAEAKTKIEKVNLELRKAQNDSTRLANEIKRLQNQLNNVKPIQITDVKKILKPKWVLVGTRDSLPDNEGKAISSIEISFDILGRDICKKDKSISDTINISVEHHNLDRNNKPISVKNNSDDLIITVSEFQVSLTDNTQHKKIRCSSKYGYNLGKHIMIFYIDGIGEVERTEFVLE